jgi:hypothetical protein
LQVQVLPARVRSRSEECCPRRSPEAKADCSARELRHGKPRMTVRAKRVRRNLGQLA